MRVDYTRTLVTADSGLTDAWDTLVCYERRRHAKNGADALVRLRVDPPDNVKAVLLDGTHLPVLDSGVVHVGQQHRGAAKVTLIFRTDYLSSVSKETWRTGLTYRGYSVHELSTWLDDDIVQELKFPRFRVELPFVWGDFLTAACAC
jgi:hypothetical protein